MPTISQEQGCPPRGESKGSWRQSSDPRNTNIIRHRIWDTVGGNTDTYREMICMGGIPECGFNPHLTSMLFGKGYMEDHYLMAKEYPLINAYWEDKYHKFENIDIPCYVTAGWNHFHLRGAIAGFRRISSKQKWLRVHRDFEWTDLYARESIADLTDFFDRYLKGEAEKVGIPVPTTEVLYNLVRILEQSYENKNLDC